MQSKCNHEHFCTTSSCLYCYKCSRSRHIFQFQVCFSVIIHSASHIAFPYCRKDFFYPYDIYKEASLPDPTDGGRFHIVTLSQGNGTLGTMTLNGKQVTFDSGQDPDNWYVDWMHVYPQQMETGKPVWISFHTRLIIFKYILHMKYVN